MIKKSSSLSTRIMIGMVLGIIIGFIIRIWFKDNEFVMYYLINGLFEIGGQVFITSLQMLVVPLVFVSLVCGTSSLKEISSFGRMGGKIFILYIATTAIAITFALLSAQIFKPGTGADLSTASTFQAADPPSLMHVIIDMFPTNPIHALSSGNTLQIIVFAVLFGIAISTSGKPGEYIANIFQHLNEVIMKLVAILMNIAPFGVFFLMTKLFTNLGLNAIYNLASYFLVLLGTLLFHAFVVYPFLLKIFTGLSPWIFFKKMEDAIIFAFSTASSNATIPVTIEATNKRLGVANKISSFTIPLGATINMDGTAIMQGVATVFIAQAFNIHLSVNDFLTVILTATIASIGTAGVPSVGLIMLAMVLRQVGLPVEGIAMIMGIDRILDMIRSSVNVTGDACATVIVAKSENALDIETFNNPNAGINDEHIQFKRPEEN